MAEIMTPREAGSLTKEYMSSYARYVAQSRAIANLVDGLKPAQRRCINSADDLHLYHDKPFMKTAKLEGQVMGDYHPHGGVSVSGLVQPFKIRYPLFEGQGSWGCPDDPNSVAASRYTELRLTKFAEDFYLESKDHSLRESNYDGRLQEVVQYFPPIPGSLITGSEGIAIGLSAKVPPHEIHAVCESLLSYLRGDNTFYSCLYPDTYEKSICLSTPEEIRRLYETGEATLKYKASTHYERVDGIHALVIDAFPPNFLRKKLQSASIMSYVDEGVLNLINESSTGIRYVFKSASLPLLEEIESLLVSSVSYKMYLEYQGVIGLYPLKYLYEVFVSSRVEFIQKKYKDLLSKVEKEISYCESLISLKNNMTFFKSLLDKEESEVLSSLCSVLKVDLDTARRILGSSLRSLFKNGVESLLSKLSTYRASVLEYRSYITDPVSKIIKDIQELDRLYKGEKNASLTESKDGGVIRYQLTPEGVLECSKSTEESLPPVGCPYYLIKDSRGFVVLESQGLSSKVSHDIREVFRTEEPVENLGILGLKDLETCKIIYQNGSRVRVRSWAIRKRLSRIDCSEGEGTPIQQIIVE